MDSNVELLKQKTLVNRVTMYKSPTTSFVLTLFFSTLGICYTSLASGVLLTIISMVLAAGTFGLSMFITWPMSILYGMWDVNNYNDRINMAKLQQKRDEEKHQELLDALNNKE